MKLKMLTPWKESYEKPRQHIKTQRHQFVNKGAYNQSYGFSGSHVWMWELDHEEGWALKSWCFLVVVLEKTLESPLDCKEIQPVNIQEISPEYSLEGLLWNWSSSTLATWCKEPIQWKRPWCWERLKAGGEGDDRGWDGWMASLTQWTWVWEKSRREWRTEETGVLHSTVSQRVGHDLATEQQQPSNHNIWRNV